MIRSRVVARMAAACAAAGIDFIPGTELTAEHNDTEIHLLGYFVDTQNETLLTDIARFQAVRQNRIREMVARLNDLNVPLQVESVFALANCKSPGRPHVARALVKAGLVGNLDEAFERFLKKNRPAWVPKAKMSALEAIELIHQAGGLAVMAHPGLNRTDDVIPVLVEAGPGRHRMFSHETLDRRPPSVIWKSPTNIICSSPAAPIATASARANRSSAPSSCPTNTWKNSSREPRVEGRRQKFSHSALRTPH